MKHLVGLGSSLIRHLVRPSPLLDWGSRSYDDVRLGLKNLRDPHRAKLAERVGAVGPILEFGCGYGANLFTISENHPEITNQLFGVDICPASVRLGEETLPSEIRLTCSGHQKMPFRDGFFHTTFTDMSLMYLRFIDVESLISEMLRITHTRLVFLEFSSPLAGKRGFLTNDGWIRNYRAVVKNLDGVGRVSVEKLNPDICGGGRWQYFAYFTTVEIQPHVRK